MADKRYILIDTDAGTDDAWALFLALEAHKMSAATGIEIVGITTVSGNAAVQNVSINVTRTLDTVQQTKIPIFQGMADYIAHDFTFFSPPWDGEDGFGEAGFPQIKSRLEPEHGVNAIIRLAEQYKRKLTIVALGPLTNLAMAVKLKPEIKTYLKELFILGGTLNAQGNATPAAEFNFYCDPEAAAMVIDTYPTACKNFRMNILGKLDTPQMQLLNKAEARNLARMTDWFPADGVLMACVVDPKLITATEKYSGQVELDGKYTRGMLVLDKGNVGGKPANLEFITEMNVPSYETYLVWAVADRNEPPPTISAGLVFKSNSGIEKRGKLQLPANFKNTSNAREPCLVRKKLESCKKTLSKCFGRN